MFFIHRRIIAVYCVIVLLMTTLIYRIYYIDASSYLTAAASNQGGYNLPVATTRGQIYDRNMHTLVNNTYQYVAAVMPTPQAATALLAVSSEEEKPALVEKLSSALPFALTIPDNNIYAHGVDIFRVPDRYGGYQYAPHVIGYLGGDGVSGVSGIERTYDDYLKAAGGKISCGYQSDAAGHIMQGAAMSVNRENEQPSSGVCLTLDRDIQKITQEALAVGCEKGGVVVMEAATGDILAMASVPYFDQNNIAASLESEDAPFISRAISGYNIGSVFKLVVSSAALEKGISGYRENVCTGSVDVGGVVFRCNNDAVHGVCDMQRALQVSCNSYFITLAQELDPDYLLSFCQNLGFSKSVELADGMTTQAGNLPDSQELKNPAALANFGFGQGSSLATPLQMAGVVSAIVNGGHGVTPRLVRGFTADGAGITSETSVYAENRVLSEDTAEHMRQLMAGVVSNGSGRTAKPVTGGAGGKTSSAQTGQYDENGKEIVHAWFVGFYPEEEPKYSIAVFVEGGESGEHVAAPIFKNIADGIVRLNKQG